jgi:hypothetical protein
MMSDLAKDRLATHAVTNYLVAGYQGRFTFLNVLAQLQYPNVTEEALTFVRQALDRIAFWIDELWHDRFLFAAQWTAPQTFDSRQALELLDQLKPDLYSTANEIVRIIALPNPHEKFENTAFLCAAFGRFAYARENYIKGFIDFSNKFGEQQEASRYAALLPPAQEDVRLTHTLLSMIRDPNASANENFTRGLTERCVPLIAVFRTHVHDINQLLGQFRGGMSFDKADFTVQEATAWNEIGLGPVPAGYWRANAFSPADAGGWIKYGFSIPSTASSWRVFGFTPDTARPWAQLNFAPPLARLWVQVGYSPEEAKQQNDLGITDPLKAPHKAPPA